MNDLLVNKYKAIIASFLKIRYYFLQMIHAFQKGTERRAIPIPLTPTQPVNIRPKIIEEPYFECGRRSRIHSKCELFLNFRIGS